MIIRLCVLPNPPFAVATAAKQMLALELLCQCGVNVNMETKAGRTALLVAVTKDLLDVSTYHPLLFKT